jgi:hypothetical protein
MAKPTKGLLAANVTSTMDLGIYIEETLGQVWGRGGDHRQYIFTDVDGQRLELSIERIERRVELHGPRQQMADGSRRPMRRARFFDYWVRWSVNGEAGAISSMDELNECLASGGWSNLTPFKAVKF